MVGDLVELKAGDYVPADMRLTETHNLKCDESSLTGESHAVFKDADVICDEKTPLADRANMAFSGTNVTFGKGTGIVVKVGRATQMGAIAKILNKQIKDKSPLEKNIDRIGKIITFGVLAIVAVVFITELIFCSRLNVLEAFLISVALAVAAIPESLPAVITIIMALGVERLAKRVRLLKPLTPLKRLAAATLFAATKRALLPKTKCKLSISTLAESCLAPTNLTQIKMPTLCVPSFFATTQNFHRAARFWAMRPKPRFCDLRMTKNRH